MVMTLASHTPVMLDEVIQALAVQPGGRYVDCTLGGGGHAAAIMEQASPGGQLLGIDADPGAIERAKIGLARYRDSVLFVNDNFVNLEAVCIKYDFRPVHGILFDLGLSTLQLGGGRGFSFQEDVPLDMRFNPRQKITAADIVNSESEIRLTGIIREYGEENFARQIARHIVAHRPINTTGELASVIEGAVGGRHGRIHPATRTFQALRIAVNNELENLELALGQAVRLLGAGGRLVVLSYHSLEDRIVKQFMQREARGCICPPGIMDCICGHKPSIRILNKKVLTPSPEEVRDNPRSRSAKLRAAERIVSEEEYYDRLEEEHLLTETNGQGWRRPSMLRKLRIAYAA